MSDQIWKVIGYEGVCVRVMCTPSTRIKREVRFQVPGSVAQRMDGDSPFVTAETITFGSFRAPTSAAGGARPRGAARASKNFETFCFSLGDAMTELEETHNQLLLLRGYACEAVCKGSDALFESVAGPLRPACAPCYEGRTQTACRCLAPGRRTGDRSRPCR